MDRGEQGVGHAAGMKERYEAWLEAQPLAEHTRRAYRRQVRGFLDFLATYQAHHGDPLRDAAAGRFAAEDYRQELLVRRGRKPATANQALAALDHLFRFLGWERPAVARLQIPAGAPRALEPDELKRFLRAVETCPSVRGKRCAEGVVDISPAIPAQPGPPGCPPRGCGGSRTEPTCAGPRSSERWRSSPSTAGA